MRTIFDMRTLVTVRIESYRTKYYANELAKTHLTAKSISITLWPTDKIGQSAVHLTECTAICGLRTEGQKADCIQVLQLGNFRGGLSAHKISMRMRFLINVIMTQSLIDPFDKV